MLLILNLQSVFFLCIYFTHLSLLLNLDEMQHSQTSIYVTMFVVVMFFLKVRGLFESKYKILFSVYARKGDMQRKLFFTESYMMSLYVLLYTMKILRC